MRLKKLGLFMLFCLTWHNLMLIQWQIIRRRRNSGRRWWVRPINRTRNAQGFYANLVHELLESDHEEFFALYRMWPEQFRLLADLVRPHLKKKSIRTPLPTELRLSVTLMYLAQGDTGHLKHCEYRIGRSTVYKIIHETKTCQAIWAALQPIVLKTPDKDGWKKISEDFMQQWQFPNCIGAIDGRHMRIKAPPMSGSLFYNYKQFFSMVLLATCDSHYGFTWVDIGQYGSISDGGVWSNTDLAKELAEGNVDLPNPSPLPGTDRPFPYVFVGDAAFPLSMWMMRPYSRIHLTDEKRVFNYRLSRARRTFENAFGILTARWQILHKPLQMSAENCSNLFKALVCLHNFIMIGENEENACGRRYAPNHFFDSEATDGSILPGEWRRQQSQHFAAIGRVGSNRANAVAVGMRDYLTEYFVSDSGMEQAPWQEEYTFRGANIRLPGQ